MRGKSEAGFDEDLYEERRFRLPVLVGFVSPEAVFGKVGEQLALVVDQRLGADL